VRGGKLSAWTRTTYGRAGGAGGGMTEIDSNGTMREGMNALGG